MAEATSQAQLLTVVVMLAPHEQTVLRLLAQGYSTREVADELGMTPRNVESKIQKVRRKTGTRNCTHAVARAVQQGWI